MGEPKMRQLGAQRLDISLLYIRYIIAILAVAAGIKELQTVPNRYSPRIPR